MNPTHDSHRARSAARADRADGDDRSIVLFDLDGVLTRRDTFSTLVARRLRRSPWRLVLAAPALPVLALTGWQPRVRGYASRYLVRVALAGLNLGEARAMSQNLGEEFAGTADWLRPSLLQVARDHVAARDRVVVVTATEWLLARALLDGVGLGKVELHASELGPTRTGPGLIRHNYGTEKRRTLLAASLPGPWSTMYSDSWADADLLDHVANVVLVAPSNRLRSAALRRWGDRCSVVDDS